MKIKYLPKLTINYNYYNKNFKKKNNAKIYLIIYIYCVEKFIENSSLIYLKINVCTFLLKINN